MPSLRPAIGRVIRRRNRLAWPALASLPTAAAARSVGVMPSPSCSRCRPTMQPGSKPSLTRFSRFRPTETS